MKLTIDLLLFATILMLFYCEQPNKKTNSGITTADTTQGAFEKEEKRFLAQRKMKEERDYLDSIRKEQAYLDSIRLEAVLQSALQIANQHINERTFSKKYEISPDSVTISVEIDLDYYFSKEKSDLIIRRKHILHNAPDIIRENILGYMYIDIYSKNEDKFDKIFSCSKWVMEYTKDTVCDINGDDLNDLVINWYGTNGCCLKAFSDVYILRKDKKSFSQGFEFINPTFSPKEKIIRGVCYGHPGETEMYKYRWNKDKIDTVEYVLYERDAKGGKTGKILIASSEPYSKQFKILKRVNNVPNEYRKINGYDWFIGN